ncbi:hypothetical protein SISNIDRAFT_491401 [Sistotremastrum niveocremeum HHB9708]|uniref:Uncharacterized protein n=1 Tax=Sistotremastrum niveocremeum HHB9708 TaxID=1314777 RepID=A0A164MUM6_9AGAM|nr:hypothetical protein SISNIDRAFT_491401 [Sistotremastrum niveocremeum HHB9708]
MGTQIGEYTRWTIDVFPGEKFYLRTFVRSNCTDNITNFFFGSALSLARDYGVDVHSLSLVSRTGLDVNAFLTISNEPPSTIYYFAYSPQSDGSVPEPPGFWSFCPDPLCSACRLDADAAPVVFHAKPFVEYEMIIKPTLSVLQDFEAHNFLPVPDVIYASDPPFASITEISDQQTPDPIITSRGKKRRRTEDLHPQYSRVHVGSALHSWGWRHQWKEAVQDVESNCQYISSVDHAIDGANALSDLTTRTDVIPNFKLSSPGLPTASDEDMIHQYQRAGEDRKAASKAILSTGYIFNTIFCSRGQGRGDILFKRRALITC